jgi:hypothetical protein
MTRRLFYTPLVDRGAEAGCRVRVLVSSANREKFNLITAQAAQLECSEHNSEHRPEIIPNPHNYQTSSLNSTYV